MSQRILDASNSKSIIQFKSHYQLGKRHCEALVLKDERETGARTG